MITASHNPSKYNGYKVYGSDGCQITTEATATILAEIERLDLFEDVQMGSFETGVEQGLVQTTKEEVYRGMEEVKVQSVLFGDEVNRDLSLVYTPLHGASLKLVTQALKELGYSHVTVVKEQERPDGHFSTCPYPNPKVKEALTLGLEVAKRQGADLLLATDPDCDRVGIAVRDKEGVGAACMICEMAGYYSTKGISLLETSTRMATILTPFTATRLRAVRVSPRCSLSWGSYALM